jgi:very-short-patch-repair endonuclease
MSDEVNPTCGTCKRSVGVFGRECAGSQWFCEGECFLSVHTVGGYKRQDVCRHEETSVPMWGRSRLEGYVARRVVELGYRVHMNTFFYKHEVDIYLPDFHIGIEVNGPQHELKIAGDRSKAEILFSDYALPILVVDYTEVDSKMPQLPPEVKNRIITFVQTWSATSDKRKGRFQALEERHSRIHQRTKTKSRVPVRRGKES